MPRKRDLLKKSDLKLFLASLSGLEKDFATQSDFVALNERLDRVIARYEAAFPGFKS